MTHILLVAKNAFRAVMSQRALYMWAFAVVIMFLRSGPALRRSWAAFAAAWRSCGPNRAVLDPGGARGLGGDGVGGDGAQKNPPITGGIEGPFRGGL